METLFFSRCHNDKTNLSEYALYKWHHPEGNVPYDTSDLVVACESDPDRFVIELKSEGDSPTLTGSKYDPVVSFTVPANTSTDDREWKIFVSGTDCRQSVVQRSMYTDVTIGETTWARGNIVLKDGPVRDRIADRLRAVFPVQQHLRTTVRRSESMDVSKHSV